MTLKHGMAKKDGQGNLIANIALAEDVFDHIVNFETAWRQGEWRFEDRRSDCGTAACAAGWAGIVSGLTFGDDIGNLEIVVIEGPLSRRIPGVQASEVRWPNLNLEVTPTLARRFHRTAHISRVARQLLGVGYGRKSLSAGFFDGENRLVTLRSMIDQARLAQGLEPRDFTEEPVPVLRTGRGTGPIRNRVRAFNKRAKQGRILAAREAR